MTMCDHRAFGDVDALDVDQRLSHAHQFCTDHLSRIRRRADETYADHAAAVTTALEECMFNPSLLVVSLLHDIPLHPSGIELLEHARLLPDERRTIERWHRLRLKVQQHADYDWPEWHLMRDPRLQLLAAAHHMVDLRNASRIPAPRRSRFCRWVRCESIPRLRRAHLLGWAAEAEDRCFVVLEPDVALPLKERHDALWRSGRPCIESMVQELTQYLPLIAKAHCTISWRVKGLFSTHAKMMRKNLPFHHIHDVLGVRIIVPSTHACYGVLSWLHSQYRQVKRLFDDFIHAPKMSGYRSLHTVILLPSPSGPLPVEVQLRTEEMHWNNEYGTANHHEYKRRGLQMHHGYAAA